jgi:benzoyl-CoA reductase/2-hydroxyglutaryl-CoA dehydratase subunit BcrC/BadD/HgdB
MADPQFDERYRLPARHVEDPGVLKRARFVENEQRRIQSEIRNRPENIAWFEDLLAAPAGEMGRPLVGYFCNMIPPELIRALGADPVRLGCGNPAMVQPGEEVFSGEICPLAKASFAAFMDAGSPANRCAALLLPTSCDAKRKLGEVLSDFKPTFMLNIPPEQDAGRFGKMAGEEFSRMADFLAAQLGRKLAGGALLREIEKSNRRTLLVRRLQEARAAKPAALSVRDLFLVVQSSFAAAEPGEWLEQAGKVLAHVEAFDASRRRMRPRLVLTGGTSSRSPVPTWSPTRCAPAPRRSSTRWSSPRGAAGR